MPERSAPAARGYAVASGGTGTPGTLPRSGREPPQGGYGQLEQPQAQRAVGRACVDACPARLQRRTQVRRPLVAACGQDRASGRG